MTSHPDHQDPRRNTKYMLLIECNVMCESLDSFNMMI